MFFCTLSAQFDVTPSDHLGVIELRELPLNVTQVYRPLNIVSSGIV